MYLRPTHASQPPETAVLVYDGGCPFCTVTAFWLQRHAREPMRLLTFDDVGDKASVEDTGLLTQLTRLEVEGSAHLITTDGIEYHGGESITRSLRLTRFGAVAAPLDLPILRYARDAAYTVITHLRPLLSRFIHP